MTTETSPLPAHPVAAEIATLREQLAGVQRERPLSHARVAQLRDERDRLAEQVQLAEARQNKTGVRSATLPVLQQRLADVRVQLRPAELEVAQLDRLAEHLPERIAALEQQAARIAELLAAREARAAQLAGERQRLLDEGRPIVSAFVRYLCTVGTWNWERGLLVSDEPPQLGSFTQRVRRAEDALVEPIGFDEVATAYGYWRQLPLMPGTPAQVADLAAPVPAVERQEEHHGHA